MAGIGNTRWKSELDTRTASELYHDGDKRGAASVSYTHLTLPTKA